jgi:hypothetical protein
VTGEVFGLFADDGAEPFSDFGGVDIVVVDPVFVSGVVGGVDVDTFDLAGVVRQECLEGKEVVALDEEISGVGLAGGEGWVGAQEVVWHLSVVVDDGTFSDPIERRHGCTGPSKQFV